MIKIMTLLAALCAYPTLCTPVSAFYIGDANSLTNTTSQYSDVMNYSKVPDTTRWDLRLGISHNDEKENIVIAKSNPSIQKNKSPLKKQSGSGVFGSVPISFSMIATGPKWQEIYKEIKVNKNDVDCGASSMCRSNETEFAKIMSKGEELSFYEKLELVNSKVNRMIAYQADNITYKRRDYWAAPKKTLEHGYGDCEDYVILKMAMLRRLNIPMNSMSMVVLKDTKRQLYHAVLAVSTTKGNFILDNVHSNVVVDSQIPHYLPIYSFSEEKSWIHGWKKDSSKKLLANSSNLRLVDILPGGSGRMRDMKLQGLSNETLTSVEPIRMN